MLPFVGIRPVRRAGAAAMALVFIFSGWLTADESSADGAGQGVTPAGPVINAAREILPPGALSRSVPIKLTTDETVFTDGFESPLTWQVFHDAGTADVDWGSSSYRASSGSNSLWCAATGSASPGDGGDVPANSKSWVVAGPFDLSSATSGELQFDLWLETESGYDYFKWLASTDGSSFGGFQTSTSTSGFQTSSVDLSDWGSAGNVLGQPEVWIAFIYESDSSNTFEGAYVDQVNLSVSPKGLTYSPASPEIGQLVLLSLTGYSVDLKVDWDFGENGCLPDYPEERQCLPIYGNCHAFSHKFASAGPKTVSAEVYNYDTNAYLGSVSGQITIQDSGSCGGGTTCTYGLNPENKTVQAAGETVTFSVYTQAGCDWTASTTTGWIAVNAPVSGTGNGSVTYQVAPNSGVARSGSVRVENHTHGVFQLGCTVSIDPASRDLDWQGGSEIVDVSADVACAWDVWTPDSWIVLTSSTSGVGSGTVAYEIPPNEGAPRVGSIFIGDQLHTVNQDEAGPCGQGDVKDDGSAENGYGWGTGSLFVQEFTPDSYPFVYTDVCAAFTQAGGDSTLPYDVVIFDDDGPGGSPGTLLAEVPAFVDGVPPWLEHVFGSVTLESDGIVVGDGSVFIGASWDDTTEIGFFVAADESTGTSGQTGFYSSDGSTWSAISSTFPGYRSLLLRADGFSPVDGEWEQKVGSIFGGGNGFGDSANSAVVSMAGFDGGLFVGTENHFGGEVNYTVDGQTWYLANTPGFGTTANDAVVNLVEFDGFLYAATLNPSTGTQVWRLETPAGGWMPAASGGFGDVGNESAPSGSVFNGDLYLGTSHSSGCEIWRTSDGTAWGQVHTNGFGNTQNEVAESMSVFRDELRVGTRNISGAELWRSPDGVVWFSVMTGGFGSSANEAIRDLAVFDGVLYAGVSNSTTGAQIWRSVNGASWTHVVDDGFGNPDNMDFDAFAVGDLGLMASVSGPTSTGTAWLSLDGVSWISISSAGFANPDNSSIETIQYWGDRVYAGTSNPTAGCEVWRGDRHPLFEDGFESGETTNWGVVVP